MKRTGSQIGNLQARIRKFVRERDWEQFHNHKNMAISIVLEATELLEHFQWKNAQEVKDHAKKHKEDISDEVADIAIYLLELAENLNIDLEKAILSKIKKTEKKYPVNKVKGKHTKYTKL